MEYKGMLLHNVQELVPDQEHLDYQMGRVPESVRLQLNPRAQKNIWFASGCELRFVMESESVSIDLRRMPVPEGILSQGTAVVYQGDYQGSYQIGPQTVTVEGSSVCIRRQDWSHIRKFAESRREGVGFSPEVTRVLLPYDWGCCIGEVRGKIRPPRLQELPSGRILFYGSSITHGGNSSLMSRTAAFRLAENLGFDSINLGCAGSARMDDAMGSWIAGRQDCAMQWRRHRFRCRKPGRSFTIAADWILWGRRMGASACLLTAFTLPTAVMR